MHMGDMTFGFIGNAGTVDGTLPTATGAALLAKVRGSNEVVASSFGDGAANQGVVHESMNLAGVWKLPVLYACENNQYAMTVSLEKSVAVKQLAVRDAAKREGPMIGGISAELAALIQENLFSDLQGPVVRIAAQLIPPPHSPLWSTR
jgi:TPP-dependent pyruvate/acetoin dehydrogenase alpha subunit